MREGIVCANFPGVWESQTPTFRLYHPCPCPACLAWWPCPDVRTGDVVEIADSHGVYEAEVVAGTHGREGHEVPVFTIASEDEGAPAYLRQKVHPEWTVTRRSALWRRSVGRSGMTTVWERLLSEL